MGRCVRILSAIAVNKLSGPGLHYVGGVPNLALQVSKNGSRSWVFRYSICNTRRDMGLGAFPEVSLSEARKVALDKRHLLRQGIDPIAQRREMLAQLNTTKEKNISFEDAAEKYIAAQRSAWRNEKHGDQWLNTLSKYAFPIIGKKRAREITLDHLLEILEPMWTTTTETGKRLRARIENILDWCKIQGFREGDNPAAWKGNLDKALPAPNKVRRVKHHAALDWNQCPAFFGGLSNRRGVSIDALKLCILTACRSGEVRGASLPEFDLEKAVWIIPGERMKAGREHRVPLSSQAVSLLRKLPRFKDEDLLFPNSQGKPLSDMALLQVVREVDKSVTVHGFRSTFRDWAGESTTHPREVAEYALAHKVKDGTEAAYARGDLFEKRRFLMNDWADFLTTGKQRHSIVPGNASLPILATQQLGEIALPA